RTLPEGRLPEGGIENIRLFRTYTELYLRNHPDVNASLDLIVTQKEATPYGIPVYVYFFINDKAWASFERKQSDIFDHLMSIVPEFGLRIYQRP
ncbi:MAG: mechanosensitive ion channel, partial [Bacteroidales bacterium]|nr:mechanosensitive ion channel [Bacteroidales bacterium]